MKFWVLVFLLSLTTQAKVLEVPEDCFSKKNSPCLIQSGEQDEILNLEKLSVRITKNTILQWTDFTDVSLDILKGHLHVLKNDKSFKLNEIYISKNQQLIERQSALITSLDLNSFVLSTYKLADIRSNTVLLRTSFLEKTELLSYVSRFFERRNSYAQFLHAIEKPWKKEFISLTESQTKVLNRAVASAEQAEKRVLEEKASQSDELKKVREQFFYRTFYR